MTATQWRDDPETTTRQPACPVCGRHFTPVGRQRHCTNACRQVAYRRRRAARRPAAALPPAGVRAHTIYQCPDCDARYLAHQWCDDCHRPCRRVGPGGECPSCTELITIEELAPGGGPMA